MSAQNKFFDEKTETILVGKYGLLSQLHHFVDLESELFVFNLKNRTSGTYRVVWHNTRSQDTYYKLGLEVVEAPDDMWGVYFPPVVANEETPAAWAWLECSACRLKKKFPIPEDEIDYLEAGVNVAEACEQCKASTTWEFQEVAEPVETSDGSATAPKKDSADRRSRRRVNLALSIKVIRQKNGRDVEEICKTLNVSRNGAYFLTSQDYQVGEILKVAMPYKKDGVAVPVSAKVIRKDKKPGDSQEAVAVQLDASVSVPELEQEEAEAGNGKPVERRAKGRVPLKLPIKVARRIHGMVLEDETETINISRTGAYFRTLQNYTLGEKVEVILPYKKGEQHIPVLGRVVRTDNLARYPGRAVAVDMAKGKD